MAVNRDRPDLTYRKTVEEHESLITKLVKQPAFNREELLREFDAHWRLLCHGGEGLRELYVAWDGAETENLLVKPGRESLKGKSRKTPIILATSLKTDQRAAELRKWTGWNERLYGESAIGIRLKYINPAPTVAESLSTWYFNTVTPSALTCPNALGQLSQRKSKEHWVVLSAEIPDGNTLFAVRWRSPAKGRLPMSEDDALARRWEVVPYRVRSLSNASLVPRGGGSLDLGDKSVLLVGCGSVGSEVACSLTSAGVGKLTIADFDVMSEENLYRHTLSLKHIGSLKSTAVAEELAQKHPWAEVRGWKDRLEAMRDASKLNGFDLVVIAIGSPTVERAFAEYCVDEGVEVAILNCWLEGYGIGGHAILSLPNSLGCWYCAYTDPNTLKPGLSSNLNFLAENQIFMRNHGGCGTQFLPFSGIEARQTAAMTATLAVRFLSGELGESSRVSWRGDGSAAKRANLKTTYRHRHFNESLQVLPLRDENCGHCGN
ncbi:MAG: ThiF family adenylyltransferase [Gemmatimonadetes bacterium]|nr:ThiF family adenylyltransferase [Gemmatimonadota bacterium]